MKKVERFAALVPSPGMRFPRGSFPTDRITEKIIGCAIEVHRNLGPGLLESAYELCLVYELENANCSFQRQVELPLTYKGLHLSAGYRMDFIVEGRVIIEIKAVESIKPVHYAQLMTYMRLSQKPTGLLLNFHSPYMRTGIKRLRLQT